MRVPRIGHGEHELQSWQLRHKVDEARMNEIVTPTHLVPNTKNCPWYRVVDVTLLDPVASFFDFVQKIPTTV